MIGQIIDVNEQTLWLFLGVIAFASVFTTIMHLSIEKLALNTVNKMDFRILNIRHWLLFSHCFTA